MYVIIFVYNQKIFMLRGEVLNVKTKYKSIINSGSTGDIISALIISIECILASTVILVNILN
jgi:DNA gyrase/topoisomerase IV subunit B